MARWTEKSKLSILWEDDSGLRLAVGTSLKNFAVVGEGVQITDAKPPKVETAFYTTSPFEFSRRARLAAKGVKDVSPKFSGQISFDPVSTFLAFPHLKGRAAFISNAKVSLTASIPTISELIKLYGSEKQRELMSRRDNYFKRRAGELDARLLPHIKFMLAYFITTSATYDTADHLYDFIDSMMQTDASHSPEDNELSNQWPDMPFLKESRVMNSQRAEARKCFELISTLFDGNTKRSLKKSISYIDEHFGEMIRCNEGSFATLTSLGFIRWSFRELSSGQASMMSLYCAIALTLGRFEQSSEACALIICIDEGEMFMHPRWQREYISGLISFITDFYQLSEKVTVVISTHSLIVATDTPAGRLFDLNDKVLKNAFGYSPKQTLTDVFNVEEFTGKFSTELLKKISDVLKQSAPNPDDLKEAFKIAETLANQDVREHIERRLLLVDEANRAKD